MTGRIDVAGEPLILSPERAVYWPRLRTLLVADPHFGKAASFRALGVQAPVGTTTGNLSRLDRLVANHGPRRIAFLGDFLHAKEGRAEETFATLRRWRAGHSRVEMVLVRGNHDRRAGDPPPDVGIECVDGPLLEPPFALQHHPAPVVGSYVLAGHVHPCVVLAGPARQRERLACFWFGRDVGVLPAFGEFTGCAEVDARPGDRLWVLANGSVEPVRINPGPAGGTPA